MLRRTHVLELVAVALCVVALLVAFKPWRQHLLEAEDFSIPAPPAFPEMPVHAPDPVAKAESVVASPAAPGTSQPQLDARGLPRGWVVQAGRFADETQAVAEVKRLLALDYDAFLQEAGEGFEVLVGPKLDPRAAEALKSGLAAQGVVSPEVREYQPSLGRSMRLLAPR